MRRRGNRRAIVLLPLLVALAGCAGAGHATIQEDAPALPESPSHAFEVKQVQYSGRLDRVCVVTCTPLDDPIVSETNGRYEVEGARFADGMANLTLTWTTDDPRMQELTLKIWPYTNSGSACCQPTGPIISVSGRSPLHLEARAQPESESLGLAVVVNGPWDGSPPATVMVWTPVDFLVEGIVTANGPLGELASP